MRKDEDEEDYELLLVPKSTNIVKRYEVINNHTIKIDFRLIKRKNTKEGVGIPRPPCILQSAERVRQLCDKYFESCNGVLRDSWGNPLRNENGEIEIGQVRPYTISGLARHLGIATNTLKKYRRGYNDDVGFGNGREQISEVLIEARQRVEEYAENRLYDKDGSYGARFVLDSGFGWHTTKEAAEIKNMQDTAQLKKDEFEFKKDSLSAGDDDAEFTINIVRGKKNE